MGLVVVSLPIATLTSRAANRLPAAPEVGTPPCNHRRYVTLVLPSPPRHPPLPGSPPANQRTAHAVPSHHGGPPLSRSDIDYPLLARLPPKYFRPRPRGGEIGCFFGGSTMPCPAGLAANAASKSTNLRNYDSFVMFRHKTKAARARFPFGLHSGECSAACIRVPTPPRSLPTSPSVRLAPPPPTLRPATDPPHLYHRADPIEILFSDCREAVARPRRHPLTRLRPPPDPELSICSSRDFKGTNSC